MEITRKSKITGIEHTMDLPVTPEQFQVWEKGDFRPIQAAFPHLTPEQREFILTGITPEEWDTFIKTEEDED